MLLDIYRASNNLSFSQGDGGNRIFFQFSLVSLMREKAEDSWGGSSRH